MAAPDFDALKQSKTTSFGVRTWNPKKGENRIRVLAVSKEQVGKQYGGGDEPPSRIDYEFRQHFLKVGGEWKVFRCLRDLDQHCPACAFHFQFKEDRDEAIKKTAENFNNSIKHLINIVDLDEPGKGVQPWAAAMTARNLLLDLIAGGRWGDCLDPGENGRGFILTKLEKTPWYSVEPLADTESITEHLTEGWLDELDTLPEYVAETWPADKVEALVDQAKQLLGMAATPATQMAPPDMNKSKATAVEEAPVEQAKAPPPAEEVSNPEPEEEEPEEEAQGEGCEHGNAADDCVECRLAAMGL